MELIPYIGPVLGALPPVLVALFSDDPLDALWVALLFLALQQLEGHVVAPQVFGHALRINPLLVIFALLLGGQLYGIVGALVALPIAAMLRETVVYLRRHVVLEPWPPHARRVALPPGRSPDRTADEPCPECGAPRGDRRRALRRVRDRAGRRRRGRVGGVAPRSRRDGRRRSPPAALTRRRRHASATATARALRDVELQRRPRRAGRGHRAQRRRQDDAAVDPRRDPARRRRRGLARRRARSAGSRSSRRSTRSCRWPRTCACSRGWRRWRTSRRPSRGCSSRPACADRAGDELGKLSGGNRSA